MALTRLNIRALIALGILASAALSLLRTTWKARQILRRALGRKLKPSEELSIRTWMTASDADLETASQELSQNPLDGVAGLMATGDVKSSPPLGLSDLSDGHDGKQEE